YQFSFAGRHKYTLDAMSADTLLAFTYDASGRLASVKDGTGNITTVQRDGSGNPTGILGPYGQQTALTLDAGGFLRQVTDPGGLPTKLYHGSAGLLDSLIDARGKKHAFLYDALGRLLRDDNPDGGRQTLVRTVGDTGYAVSRTTIVGRQTVYRVDELENGDERWEEQDPAGLKTVTLRQRDGTTVTTAPDGTVARIIEAADPRFGPQSPIVGRLVVKLPSGDSVVIMGARSASGTSSTNPLSVTATADTTWIAGQRFVTAGSRSGAIWTETSTTPLGRQSLVRLDSLGRVTVARPAGLDSVRYSYDPQGRLSQITDGGRIVSYGYDNKGRLARTTDPLGRTDSLLYDSSDRLVRTRAWDGRQLLFAYDSASNLTSVTPPGHHRFPVLLSRRNFWQWRVPPGSDPHSADRVSDPERIRHFTFLHESGRHLADTTQADTRRALIYAVTRWASTLDRSKVAVTVADPPRPEWDVKVTPANPRAAEILLRTDAPGKYMIHVGASSWWDHIPFSEQSVRDVCSSIANGGFAEWRRIVAGKVVATRGEFMVGTSRWADSGSIPLAGLMPGDDQELRYEPY
ncbi:MAG: hypothetical protein ACREMW_15820, partial [Gemmatimonadales bacterium]